MNHDLFDVRDSVCLVTGASSGIGVAIAAGLAEGGAKVVLAARRLDRLQKFEQSLSARGHAREGYKMRCNG